MRKALLFFRKREEPFTQLAAPWSKIWQSFRNQYSVKPLLGIGLYADGDATPKYPTQRTYIPIR